VLGGGSNLVIADGGVDGLVLKIGLRGVTTRDVPGAVEVIGTTATQARQARRSASGRGASVATTMSGTRVSASAGGIASATRANAVNGIVSGTAVAAAAAKNGTIDNPGGEFYRPPWARVRLGLRPLESSM